MNTMFVTFLILTLVAMAFVAVPLWRGRRTQSNSANTLEQRRETNRAVFVQRQAELDLELEQGVVSPEDHTRLLTDLQRAFLRDMEELSTLQVKQSRKAALWVPVVSVVLIPVVSVVLYQQWGASRDLALPAMMQAVREAPDEEAQRAAIEAITNVLQERFERMPDDLQSAYLLGIYYLQVERNAEAASVFERMSQDMPDSPDLATVIGQWAQAEYLMAEAQINDKVQGLLDRALQLNPNESSALTILAFDALGKQDLVSAVGYFRRQLAAADANSQQAQVLRQRIAAIEAYIPEDQRDIQEPAASVAKITLVIDLDPQFKDQLDQFQSMFVYVRSTAMPMPILAQNLPVSEFPLTLELDDSMSMAGMTLNSAPELLAGARLSRQGVANRQVGDIQAESAPFKLSEQIEPLRLTIDQVIVE